MRKLFAALQRALAAALRFAWIGGRLVAQPIAGLFGVDLFTEEEFQAAWDHVDTAGRAVGRGLSKAARTVANSGLGEGLANAGKAVGSAAVGVATLPIKALSAVGSALTGGGGSSMDPAVAAAQAAAAVTQEASSSNRDSELRSMARVLQRVLNARAAGEKPSPMHLERLPEGVRNYVLALSADEVRTAAQAGKPVLIQVLAGQRFPGCRTPTDVRSDEAEVRRSQLVVANGLRRNPTRSVDDIMSELEEAPAISARR